jgi:hypothetical protein
MALAWKRKHFYLLVQTGVAIDHLFKSVHLVVVDLPLNPGLQEIVTFSWKKYFTLLLLILVTGRLKFNDD